MNLNLNKLSGVGSILGLPTGPFSALFLVWFCFLISLLLSPMFVLGEEDFFFSNLILLILFPVQVVKLTIQTVKNLQSLYRNLEYALLPNTLNLASLE